MTEQELIQKQQEYGTEQFVVTRSGKFFCAYGCGGSVVEQGENSFVFSGIDGSEDEGMVSEQKPPKERKCSDLRNNEAGLHERILSFDLSRSTPMEAMNFIDTLQKLVKGNNV